MKSVSGLLFAASLFAKLFSVIADKALTMTIRPCGHAQVLFGGSTPAGTAGPSGFVTITPPSVTVPDYRAVREHRERLTALILGGVSPGAQTALRELSDRVGSAWKELIPTLQTGSGLEGGVDFLWASDSPGVRSLDALPAHFPEVFTGPIGDRVPKRAALSAAGRDPKGTGQTPEKTQPVRRKGRPKKVSDEEIAGALLKFGGKKGVKKLAAKDLGIGYTSLFPRIKNAASDSPLAVFQGQVPRAVLQGIVPFRRRSYSDLELAKALKRHKGNRAAATRELGLSHGVVTRRVWHSKPGSPLFRFRKIKSSRKKISDKKLADVLERNGGNQSAAAREISGQGEIKIAKATIGNYIRQSGRRSPLARFKVRSSRPGLNQKVTEERLAEALARHGGVHVAAAADVKITGSAVTRRIQRARAGSPLWPFKTGPSAEDFKKTGRQSSRKWYEKRQTFKKTQPFYPILPLMTILNSLAARGPQGDKPEGSPPRLHRGVSDDELAEALWQHGGHRREAALDCGLSPSVVIERLAKARPPSILAEVREIRHKRGPVTKHGCPSVSDEKLAHALERHGGNQARAGADVGLSQSGVSQRVKRAHPDSLLGRFKKK